MQAIAITLLAALFVGGLALLAHAGRKNRRAEISLVVVMLFVSLLSAGLAALSGIGLIVLGQTGAAQSQLGTIQISGTASVVAGVMLLVTGLALVGLCIPPLVRITGRRLRREWLADPPTFLAIWLFVAMLANAALSFVFFTQIEDFASLLPGGGSGRLPPALILANQLPFLLVGVLGVGPAVSRGFRQTLDRLGYGGISLPQLGVVVAFVAGALVLNLVFSNLFTALQPDLSQRVNEVSQSLFNVQGLSPTAAVLYSLLIGVGAGLGEETLFRGAAQPALGIVPVSVLFASIHYQYGLSVLLVQVFVISVGLGLLRKHINTTASFLAHAGYNFTLLMLAYFLGAGV